MGAVPQEGLGMVIDMARERATRAIRESLLAARNLAASSGNTVLLQQVDDALRALAHEHPPVFTPAGTPIDRAGGAPNLDTKAD